LEIVSALAEKAGQEEGVAESEGCKQHGHLDLAVEMTWLALGGPFLSFLAQAGVPAAGVEIPSAVEILPTVALQKR